MKKVFAVIISLLLIVSLAACGQANEPKNTETAAQETEADNAAAGAYSDASSPVITKELKAVFDKATEGFAGVGYVPAAYVSSQVVAGTNHLFLCKATPVTDGAVTKYALVTVYEDLNGNAEITDVLNSQAVAPAPVDEEEPVDGGTVEAADPTVTAEAKAALEKACEGLSGASYEAKALLAAQVVAGFNYTLLCKITPVVPDAESHYSVVVIYEDLEGNAEITETYDFGEAAAE